MEIKTVYYSTLVNLGNYNNEKIGLKADVSEGETVEQVIEALRDKITKCGHPNLEKLYKELRDRTWDLEQLNNKIEKATNQWNSTAEFLRTQGIKPDAVDLPVFTHLLPEAKSETIVTGDEAEFVDEDNDEAEF